MSRETKELGRRVDQIMSFLTQPRRINGEVPFRLPDNMELQGALDEARTTTEGRDTGVKRPISSYDKTADKSDKPAWRQIATDVKIERVPEPSDEDEEPDPDEPFMIEAQSIMPQPNEPELPTVRALIISEADYEALLRKHEALKND